MKAGFTFFASLFLLLTETSALAGTQSSLSLPGSSCDAVKGWSKFDDGGMYSSNAADRIGINCAIPNYFGVGAQVGKDVKEVIQVRVILIDESSAENVDCTLYSSSKDRSSNVKQTLSSSGTGIKELIFSKPATQYVGGYIHLLCNMPKMPTSTLKPSGLLQYQIDYNQL